ncbi:hypothetical protein AK830_g4983 [Neonectria ditissima]|uniref:Uncharacterized protein n=1 Tax=Neonectria ditissima TaxID=78410 RepID=A0A0N8H7F2_9HYPO|nr:hypothetical protein AK830_g4983 [Neonectria ditissima]
MESRLFENFSIFGLSDFLFFTDIQHLHGEAWVDANDPNDNSDTISGRKTLSFLPRFEIRVVEPASPVDLQALGLPTAQLDIVDDEMENYVGNFAMKFPAGQVKNEDGNYNDGAESVTMNLLAEPVKNKESDYNGNARPVVLEPSSDIPIETHANQHENTTFVSTNQVELTTSESLLEEQDQYFKQFLSAYNAQAQEQRTWLASTVSESFNRVTTSLNSLNKRLRGPKCPTETMRIKQQLEDALRENKTLETQLYKANEKLKIALHERDNQRRIADGGPLANSKKETDDTIRSKWKLLDYNISNLARHLGRAAPSHDPDYITRDIFHSVCPTWRGLFGVDDDRREFLIQGYLWRFVQNEVFNNTGSLSGTPTMRHLKHIQTTTIVEVEKRNLSWATSIQRIAKWRAQGSALLGEIWGDDHDRKLRELTTAETRRLRPFWTAQLGSSDRSENRTWDELKAILECALELDHIMMGSKAHIQILWGNDFWKQNGRPLYNPDFMEAVGWKSTVSSRSSVDFFASPMLEKVGNADGQNYDSQMVLVKANVVCN